MSQSPTYLSLMVEEYYARRKIQRLDLELPPELHDKFKAYPPCAESRAPRVHKFSYYTNTNNDITYDKPMHVETTCLNMTRLWMLYLHYNTTRQITTLMDMNN